MTDLIEHLPADWADVLQPELDASSIAALTRFVAAERENHTVYPPAALTFAALEATPPDMVKAVILGQDPYHGPGQAHGLAFSVPPGVPPPPSLRTILREWHEDLGQPLPDHGCLLPWARNGVLLLNAVLTVRANDAHSHRNQGWEDVTDALIRRLQRRDQPIAFLLWGKQAQRKQALIDTDRHAVLCCPHPSPLSAYRGFFGSKPFSRTNAALVERGVDPVDWRLPRTPALSDAPIQLQLPLPETDQGASPSR